MTQLIHDHEALDWERPGKASYEVAFPHDGTWGNVLAPLTVINGLNGSGRSVVCFGGTHGNEYEGQVAIRRLALELDAEALTGRVILMPRLNEPACVAGTRASPLDGGNMNRAFPGDPRGTITSRIADFVTRRIFPRVDVVLDMHSAGSGMRFALCSSFHPMQDRAQRAETERVARLFDTPFIMVYSSEMAHGLLTDQAEALGKVTVGGEFGYAHSVDLQGTRHVHQGILNVLRHYGMLPGQAERVRPDNAPATKVVQAAHLEDYLPAPITGVYEPLYEVGTRVHTGQIVGRLHDFERTSEPALELPAPRDGYLLMQAFQAPTERGTTILVIAEEIEEGSDLPVGE
jgi:predicted deacylase